MRVLLIVAALLIPLETAAQDEMALRQFFEGKSVVVKIDMPATSDGINVHPLAGMPVEFPEVAEDLKDDGVGIHQGESIMVTKVHIKGDHIEFQLGGGGFGTFSDALSVASLGSTTAYQGETGREKEIKEALKHETDPDRRQRLLREMAQVKQDRRAENNEVSRENAEARREQEQARLEAAARSGSRFNIRYSDGFPAGALTPEGVMDALADYVDFPFAAAATATETSPAVAETAAAVDAAAAPTAAVAGMTALKKGLSVSQVEEILGPAQSASTENRDGLEVAIREYDSEGQKVSTQFVAGVLVDYSITPAG